MCTYINIIILYIRWYTSKLPTVSAPVIWLVTCPGSLSTLRRKHGCALEIEPVTSLLAFWRTENNRDKSNRTVTESALQWSCRQPESWSGFQTVHPLFRAWLQVRWWCGGPRWVRVIEGQWQAGVSQTHRGEERLIKSPSWKYLVSAVTRLDQTHVYYYTVGLVV